MNILKKLRTLPICFLFVTIFSQIVDAYTSYDYNYDASAFTILSLGCIIGALAWFVVWVLIAIWVYKDAEKRDSSGALWLIIVILTGIIGLIIWLVVRPPIGGEKKEPDRRCPNCGRSIPFDARVCTYCGKKFEL